LKAILDTSVLIATDVPPLEGELAISAAALAELHFGVLVTSDGAVRAEPGCTAELFDLARVILCR